jgi:dTDP-4-dehydrorhamnose reductase
MNNQNKKLKVLILGGSGLLGYHCVNFFKNKYNVLWTYYNPCEDVENGFLLAVEAKNAYSNLHLRIKRFVPDVIINTLGLVSVDASEENPILAEKLNKNFVKDIVNVLSDLKLYNCYLVQISSGGVYGKHLSNVIKPWEERDELNPLSVYATSKVEGEKEALKHKGPVLILRSDFYGLNINRKRFTLLSWIIYNIENNIKMEGWENIYFSPISAFKLCKTIDQCITSNVTGVFNVGSEDACNKFDFVEAVGKIINKKPDLMRIEAHSKIRPRYSVLCCDKIKNKINFNCKWKDTLNDYISNQFKINI